MQVTQTLMAIALLCSSTQLTQIDSVLTPKLLEISYMRVMSSSC